MPTRVQRTRKAGQPGIPAGAVYVGRPTRWGNPSRVIRSGGGWAVEYDHDGKQGGVVGTFTDVREARRFATDAYREHLKAHPELAEVARREFAGRDLACWCPLPQPGEPDHCHAAVLLQAVAEQQKA